MTGLIAAFVGLGSNLDDPVGHVRCAAADLGRLPGSRLRSASRLYESEPFGPQDQPRYVNAVVLLETPLAPEPLLDELLALERAHGRVRDRSVRWGPRPLDLDLLLYGDQVVDNERLRVPHPELANRGFVLYPLVEIAGPAQQIPGVGALGDLCRRVARNGLRVIGPPPTGDGDRWTGRRCGATR